MGVEYGALNRYSSYGQPSLDLVFTGPKKSLRNRLGNQQVEFTRGSTATYTDENGIIRTAADNEARFDHDGDGNSLGLLIEESRTNYDKNSAVLGQWSRTNLTETQNQAVAPDSTFTASRYTITTANSDHYLSRNTGTNHGDPSLLGNNSISFFVKPDEHSKFVILFRGGSGGNWESRAAFDLTTNTQTAVAVGRYIFGNPSSTNVEVFPNGWYRLTMNWNRSSNQVGGTYAFIPYDSLPSGFTNNTTTWGSYDFAGDGSSGFYLWGSQIELGSFPTSYIPTSGSTVTRAADVASITGSNFTSIFTGDYPTGTIYTNYSRNYNFSTSPNTKRVWTFYNGFTNNSVQIRGDGTSQEGFYIVDGGNTSTVGLRLVPEKGIPIKAATAWDSSTMSVSFDGSSVSSTSINLPFNVDPNVFSIGSYAVYSTTFLDGHISRLTYYPTRLPDATLQALTA